VEPGRIAEIVARRLRDPHRDQEAEQALNGREERLRYAVPPDAANELRPHAVTDGEQEHQEHSRLERLVDRDPDLSDQDAGQEGRSERSQADALEGELAKVVADGKCEEDRDLRALLQRREKPINHDVSSVCQVSGALLLVSDTTCWPPRPPPSPSRAPPAWRVPGARQG